MGSMMTKEPPHDQPEGIKRLIRSGTALPFKEIMLESPREFIGPGTARRYAQAWSMFDFLFKYRDGKYASRVHDYLKALRTGSRSVQAFELVFSKDWEKLQKEWMAYVLK